VKTILFAAYGGGHIKLLLPLIKHFRLNSNHRVVVLALTTARFDCERNGIDFLSYEDFLDSSDRRAFLYGKHFLSKLSDQRIPDSESIAYMGLSYLDLVNRIGRKEARTLFREIDRHAFLPYTIADRILGKLKPDLVITTNSPKTERALVERATSHSIPSICVNDLFGLNAPWFKLRTFATKICVINEWVRDLCINHYSRDHNDIVVTGNPAFDPIQRNAPLDPAHSKKILFASQANPLRNPWNDIEGDPDLPAKVANWLSEFVSTHPDDYSLTVRYHPNEERYSVQESNRVCIDNTNDLHQSLLKHEIIVTFTSTVAVEAWLMGRSVVTVDLTPFSDLCPYSSIGISQGVTSKAELFESLANPKTESSSSKCDIPANSIERISKVAAELLT
jgi:hypothetical protein